VAPDRPLVRVFQPEPETLKGNILQYRAAISVKEKNMTEPAFGTFWGSATLATDRDNREILFASLTVTDIRVPHDSASDRLDYIKEIVSVSGWQRIPRFRGFCIYGLAGECFSA
jgi:hypothetical protein